jgi:hypothetical protein
MRAVCFHRLMYLTTRVNGRAGRLEGQEIGHDVDTIRRGMGGRFGQELGGRFGNPQGGSPKLRKSRVRQGQESLS